jgi:hypothetical protein
MILVETAPDASMVISERKESEMKCVQVVGQGVPIRLSDDEAFQLVHNDKDGEYCSKSFWKSWYDKMEEPRLYSAAASKLMIPKVKRPKLAA